MATHKDAAAPKRTRKTTSVSGFRNAGARLGRTVRSTGRDLVEGVQYFGRAIRFFATPVTQFIQGVKEGFRG